MFNAVEELRKKNRKYFMLSDIISELENIECTITSNGIYRRKYVLTAKQKQF